MSILLLREARIGMLVDDSSRFSDGSVGLFMCSSSDVIGLVVTNLTTLAKCLGTFIIVTNSDAALASKAIGPEAFN